MLKKLIVFAVLAGCGWYVYDHYIARAPITDRQARGYLPNIIKVTADQIEYLAKSGARNKKPTLVYIFASDCFLCRWHYDMIIDFAKQYSRKQLNVILLAVENDEVALSKFLLKSPPAVKVLLLKEGEQESLFRIMRKLGSDFDNNLPYIAVINKAGHFDTISPGISPSTKINGFILRSLDVLG